MTTAQVLEMSVTVNNNSPIQDYVHLDDQTQPTFPTSCCLPPIHLAYVAISRLYCCLSEFNHNSASFQFHFTYFFLHKSAHMILLWG